MTRLSNSYMMNPNLVLISNRLQDMCQFYGKSRVFETIKHRDYSPAIDLHMMNLILTFDLGQFHTVVKIMFQSELKKVA